MPAIDKVKELVYKNRIRIKEFFTDFDKLRCGNITATQFKSGLSMAGLGLFPEELEELVAAYPSTNVEKTVCYRDFCDEVHSIFTTYCLEKTPLEQVSAEPACRLDSLRYATLPGKSITGKTITGKTIDIAEDKLSEVLEKIAANCFIQRILVKPFFDDA